MRGLLLRASVVWLALMAGETVLGILRGLLLAPRIGDQPSRQVGFFVSLLLLFAIARLLAPWLNARGGAAWAVGLLWAALTFAFEIVIGMAQGFSWARILAEYDPAQGGLMAFGLCWLVALPWLTAPRVQAARP